MGRWQKNRDLSWYAKGDNSEAAQSAANARAEEIRRIKEAEQDALSEALGYPVMPKPKPLEKVEASEVEKAIKDTGDDEEADDARGVGFGGATGLPATESKADSEMMPAQFDNKGGLGGAARDAVIKRPRRRSRSRDRERDYDADRGGRRSRSRDRDRHHKHRGRGDDERRSHRRHRSRSYDRDRHHQQRPRSRNFDRRGDSERVQRSQRNRSYSPPSRRRSRERPRERDYDRRR